MGGYIMQLQDFSVNDGEGIRTNIFMAGCPLRCAWCANPEGQTLQNPLTHYEEVETVIKAIRRQHIFYRNSGGGVTFSGGEPTAQPEFLKELVDALYDEGVSLAIETCGQFEFSVIRPILEKMDLIFMDLKHIDNEKHCMFTGMGNEGILKNIGLTYQLGIPMVIRIPLIKGVNCEEEILRKMYAFLQEHAPKAKLELLSYHTYGEEKYEKLGLKLPSKSFATPSDSEIGLWRIMGMQYELTSISYR